MSQTWFHDGYGNDVVFEQVFREKTTTVCVEDAAQGRSKLEGDGNYHNLYKKNQLHKGRLTFQGNRKGEQPPLQFTAIAEVTQIQLLLFLGTTKPF